MKLFSRLSLLSILAAAGAAASKTEQKPVIVSYPSGTPDSVLQEAMDAVRKAGGVITHEYSLIKGFAAKACEEALDTVKALSDGAQNDVVIEHDQTVTINN